MAGLIDEKGREFLFEILRTPSPTGFEIEGQRAWLRYVQSFADKVEHDAYGSAWATLKGRKKATKTIMIEAHADEIGFMIKQITKEGFLRLDRMGGSDAATARGRRLRILGDKGPVLGVIGNTAIHIREKTNEKAPEVQDLYVDVGVNSAEEVAELGLRVGHPAVYSDSAEAFGPHRVVGRALDNRVGGFIIAQVLSELSKDSKAPAFHVVALNAVQEEIGGWGAKMATYRLEPDVAICLDVTHATDSPGIDHAKHGEVKLGGGPSVTHGTCNHPKVIQRMMETAKLHNIPLQHESSSRYSGTDTDQIYHQRSGVPSGLISLPLRYMHSVVEVVDLRDIERIISLLTELIRSLRPEDNFGIVL